MRPSFAIIAKTLVAASAMAFCGTCDQLSRFIQSFGYTELRPPSLIFPPGTLVVVRHTDPFEAKIICSAEESLGTEVHTIDSPTARSSLVAKRNLGFKLSATVMEELHLDNRYDNLEDLTVTLDNPSIKTLKDSDIERYARYRSGPCQRAVTARIARGDTVSMISSVIMGDMTMKASWKKEAKMEGSAKIAALQHLALEYGLEAGKTSETQVSAKGLIWGVVDDLYLAARTIEEMDEGAYRLGQKALSVPHAKVVQRRSGGMSLVEQAPFAPSQRHPAPVRRGQRQVAEQAVPTIMDTQMEIEDGMSEAPVSPGRVATDAVYMPLPPVTPALSTPSLPVSPPRSVIFELGAG